MLIAEEIEGWMFGHELEWLREQSSKHAVTVELEAHDRLVLEDDGSPFDPSAAAVDEPGTGERGRGLLLVRGFAKSLHYARREERNRTEVVLPDGDRHQ